VIPCFILARMGSTRLPKKHLLRLGGTTVIDFIVKRCQFFGFKPTVCVPEGEYDAFNQATEITDLFEGSPDNVEVRVIEASYHYKVKAFHVLDGDDPFFDPLSVLDSYQAARTQGIWKVSPSYNSQSGSGRVGTTYNLDATKGVHRNLLDTLPSYPWPQRLTLDYPEDYALIQAVERAVGGYMAPRAVVDELFVKNPQLHLVNWFRTDEWKERQVYENRDRNSAGVD
jgi:spore coat polysaccharide biosynthesis protein SpsF (cytidylyltransferase family)